jgi:putative transposase
VVDNAAEFHSVYFEMVLARYEITKKARPAAHPRHGAVCERLFGTTTTQLIHALRGNTQLAKQGRLVTKQTDPVRLACWTLSLLYDALCAYAATVYDVMEHPALGCSPREAYATGLTLGGERAQRVIAYDEAFRMQTLPSTAKGTATVDAQRGVKILGIYYWHDAFRDPRLTRRQVPVRYDPFDIGIAYAFVRDQWVLCHSEQYATLAGYSERARHLITQRLRERARSHGRSFSVSAAQLAQFLGSIEAQEVVLTQRLRDGEGRRLRAGIEAGAAKGVDSLGRATLPDGIVQEGEEPADDEQSVESAVAQAARERQRLQPYGSFL